MYLPPSFAETRAEVLRDLIHSHPLATLVALSSDGLVANHLPLQLDSADGTPGLLRGHIARANPLWRNYQAGTESLDVQLFAEHEIPWDEIAFPTVSHTLKFLFADLAKIKNGGTFELHAHDIFKAMRE